MQQVLSGSAYTDDNDPVPGFGDALNSEFEDTSNSANDVHEVERIIAKRMRNGVTEYRVKWAGYSEDSATWEPVEHVDLGARDAIEEFEGQLDSESGEESDLDSDSEEESKSDDQPPAPAAVVKRFVLRGSSLHLQFCYCCLNAAAPLVASE